MNIWPVEPEFFRKVAIMCLMAALSLPVQAGVEGEWQVVGVLNVIARIKGKSVTTTDRDQGPYRVVFKPEGMAFRMLDSKTSLLTGEWMQQARRFCVKLDRTSVNDFVAAIEKVEQARSGLAVAMTPLKTTLTGTRKPEAGRQYRGHAENPGQGGFSGVRFRCRKNVVELSFYRKHGETGSLRSTYRLESSMSILARLAIVLSVSLTCRLTVAGEPPDEAQRRCMLNLQTAGAQVAVAASGIAVRCVGDIVRGKRPPADADACLATETQALKRARAKTMAAAKACPKGLPPFGPANGNDVSGAFSSVVDLASIFGQDLAATLKSAPIDMAAARCQLTLAREFSTYTRFDVAEYGRCSRKLLIKGKAHSAADLEACLTADSEKRRKAQLTVVKHVAKGCRSMTGTQAFPGRCAHVPTTELGECLTAQAHCGATEAVNDADRLHASGHRFKDGMATHYCGERPETAQSVARQWDEQILGAVRVDTPRPPVHARNLFHLSLAMYDAWVAYDGRAKAYLTAEHPASSDIARDREIAISFAAYRILAERYSGKLALNSEKSQSRFNEQMYRLGLDPHFTDIRGDGPAAVGNRIAAAVIAQGLADGSNEDENYQDASYQAVNNPLIVKLPGIDLTDPKDASYALNPNRWQPLALDKTVTQNGIPLPDKVQTFIGAQWGQVRPFALSKRASGELYLDPGPPPRLGGAKDAEVKAQVLQLIELTGQLTPDDPATIDISPASLGNNPLGSNAGTGYPVNPISGQPYAPQSVLRGDFGRVLAEYWADGPTSETPPGHWNVIANTVSDSPGFERRFAGSGPVLDALEWDVKMYFALNGAVHDAAIAGWGAKRKYDGVRPITLVRAMAQYGQSTNPATSSYHPLGLPLKPGVVELITTETAARRARHAHLVTTEAGGKVGDIAIFSWPGSPEDVKTQYSGAHWVLGKAWVPYQRATFVTPAFPGYFSGHSVFSRSAAEVLTAMTGNPYFPGGFHEGFVAQPNQYLIHEKGPSQQIRLQWVSYFDAADQAGQSRLWGGIHVEVDDFTGRRVGHEIGLAAFAKAASYFDGTSAP